MILYIGKHAKRAFSPARIGHVDIRITPLQIAAANAVEKFSVELSSQRSSKRRRRHMIHEIERNQKADGCIVRMLLVSAQEAAPGVFPLAVSPLTQTGWPN